MTVNIQFKRGNKVNLPSSAPSGTPLWCEDSKELYIGTGDGIQKISASDNEESLSTYATIEQLNTGLSEKADAEHNHDNEYAGLNHSHSEYADYEHSHFEYALEEDLLLRLDEKADIDHNHDSDYATASDLENKSDINHNHNNLYAPLNVSINTLATSGTISLTDNSYNRISASGTVTFQLPSVSNNAVFHQILVQLYMSTVRTINLGTAVFFDAEAPDMSTTGYYNLIYEHDGTQWTVGVIKKGSAS